MGLWESAPLVEQPPVAGQPAWMAAPLVEEPPAGNLAGTAEDELRAVIGELGDKVFPQNGQTVPQAPAPSLLDQAGQAAINIPRDLGIGALEGVGMLAGAPAELINQMPRLLNIPPMLAGQEGFNFTPFMERPPMGMEDTQAMIDLPAKAVGWLTGNPDLTMFPEGEGVAGRFAQRIGNELGGAVVPGLGAGAKLASEVASGARSMDELSGLERHFAKPMAVDPVGAAAREAKYAVAAGSGAQAANEVFTLGGEGNAASDTAGSLGGAVSASALGSILGVARNAGAAAMSKPQWMDDVAQQAVTSQIINNSTLMGQQAEPFMLRGVEPQLDTSELAALFRTPAAVENLVPGFRADIGTRAGDTNLQTYVDDVNRRAAGSGNARRNENNAAVNAEVDRLAPQGDPTQFRLALQQGVDEQIASLFDEENLARAASDEATRGVTPQLPHADARGSVIRAGLQDARDVAYDENSEVFQAIEASLDPMAMKARFDEFGETLPVNAPRPAAAGGPQRVLDSGRGGEGPAPGVEEVQSYIFDSPLAPGNPYGILGGRLNFEDGLSPEARAIAEPAFDEAQAAAQREAEGIVAQIYERVNRLRGKTDELFKPGPNVESMPPRKLSPEEQARLVEEVEDLEMQLAPFHWDKDRSVANAVPPRFVEAALTPRLQATARGGVDFSEAQAIRSNLSDEQRAARASGQPYKASIAGQYKDTLDEYLETQMDPEAAAKYQEANRARFELGQRFETKGSAIEQALRKNARGDYEVDVSALPRKFVQKDTGRISDYGALMKEVGDDVNVRDAIADQVLADAQDAIKSGPDAVKQFISERNVVLSDFPEVRGRLEQAGVSIETMRAAEDARKAGEKRLLTPGPGNSPEANYLYKAKGAAFGNDENVRSISRLIKEADSRAATKQLLDTAGGGAEEVQGLRTAFFEHIRTEGKDSATDSSGNERWNPRKVRDMLKEPKTAAVAEELWRDNPDELQAIRDVFEALEAATPGKSRAPGSSGTAQALSGSGDPAISSRRFVSDVRSVKRGAMSVPVVVAGWLTNWLSHKSLALQKGAIDTLSAQVVNTPGLAADLLEKFNPADYAAKRQMLTQKYGARITNVLQILDKAHEDEDPDAEIKGAVEDDGL